MTNDIDTMRKVLEVLPASACTYQDWLTVGMVLKDIGVPCSEWDAWSASDSRHINGECARKWAGFGKRSGAVVGVGTCVEMCRSLGVWESAEPGREYGWDDAIPDTGQPSGAYRVIRPEYVAPAVIRDPGDGWNGCADMLAYVSAVFLDGETLSYCAKATSYTRKDGTVSRRPATSGVSFDVAKLKADLENHLADGDVGAVIGDTDPEAGVWVRINPMHGSGGDDQSVAAYRHALVECDEKTPEEQLAIIRKLELPCAAIVHSGGKSVHALVKIEADTEAEYQRRVDYLYDICKNNGLPLDRQNRNPSRYSRLPGVRRGNGRQYLIAAGCGKTSWDEWKSWVEEMQDDLPDIEQAAAFVESPPELAPCIIDGVLRKGHKMLVSGPSKAGKSFLLMELAMAVAEGRDWLGWKCARGSVLYINLELDAASCKNRLHDLYTAKGWTYGGQLDVWNLRGHAVPIDQLAPRLIRRARDGKYSMIIIDPIYKVITGDENAADQMARFCNFFDRISSACKCAMVYCHHHSKGEQGQKKAQDRASGSGVFARDPDALLDIIQLDIDEAKRNAAFSRRVFGALNAYLDTRCPHWQSVTYRRDDSAEAVIDACRDLVPRDELEAVAERARNGLSGATAWRIDGIFREFPPCPPRDVWFRWPLHEIDDTGMLSDALAEGQHEDQTKAKERRKEERDERDAKNAEISLEYSELGDCDIGELAKRTGMEPRELFAYIQRNGKSLGLKVEGRKVRKLNEN